MHDSHRMMAQLAAAEREIAAAESGTTSASGTRYVAVRQVAVRDGPSNSTQEFKVGELSAGTVVTALELGTASDGSLRIRIREGACGYNRPCAHQYVCKSQSCMVQETGRGRRSSPAGST